MNAVTAKKVIITANMCAMPPQVATIRLRKCDCRRRTSPPSWLEVPSAMSPSFSSSLFW
eukprot:CAMPEP_0172591380 /NCGR_PEP_ID=MMETSP1068-20121228/10137_1 /TAXON_ID=35684 /ORGANISM="Pseudopedinella elastica, Strain CCMP716" /LENGTH=58 /DNA_ID=CAMNT_0013387791 /DNA_START=181 /DNA_END=357 /DNA_ORIENTATION=+